MDYISPDRSLEGACGDPEPLFEDQDGNLLEHMDYDGEGISQHECPPLNEGLLDPADQISFLAADSLPFMNDQIPCNAMKSASTSPASPLKQAHEHNVHTEPDMQKDAAEQNLQDSYSEGHNTSVGYDIHKKTGVVDAVPPQELHESSGNDTSYFQQEITHSDTYLGDSMLAENSSRDYQLNNSGADDDEIPNSSALQMENVDTRVLHETSHNLRNGIEDDQMNGRDSSPCDEHDNENFNSAVGRNSSPRDEHDNENFNSAVAPTYSDVMEQENSGSKNCVSIPSNQWDSPRERSTRLEKGTPSPDRRVSLPLEMSPNAHSSDKLESPRPAKEVGKSAHSRSPTERRRSRSPEKHDINRRRASSRELSPHARQTSPPEKKARREHHRRGDGSPRRRSVSPRRRSSPKRRNSPRRRDSPARRKDSPARRRDSSPRRKDSSPRRRDASPRRRDASPRKRDASPRRRDSSPRRRDSPARRRDSSPRRRDSPARRRDRSKSRSPSRKADTSKHRREHGRSRSRSPHSKDHHRRSPRGRHSPRRRSPPSSHRRHSPKKAWSPPANRKTGLGKPGKNLFIAGFSYATTERELEKKFSKYGRVTSARVVRDKRSGDSRGFGFVSLERDEDADAAIRACDETEWNGRIILVEKSKAPTW